MNSRSVRSKISSSGVLELHPKKNLTLDYIGMKVNIFSEKPQNFIIFVSVGYFVSRDGTVRND